MRTRLWRTARLLRACHLQALGIARVALRAYGAPKTVADCFEHRNTVGLDVALEALKETLSTRKATADELWQFAKVCRAANVIRPYLEALGQAVP